MSNDVVKFIQDMVEYTGVINVANAQLTAERDYARELLSEAEVWLAKGVFKHHTDDLRARIAAELEK